VADSARAFAGGLRHIAAMTTVSGETLNRRTGRERRARADAVVAAGLLAALERGEIEVLFQPQFAAADSALLGAEALARWRHPTVGRIGAAELFAHAERAHRVAQVSRHVARAALLAARHWPAPLKLSLNVTADDLAAVGFPSAIAGLLAESGFPAERLTLAITEQSIVADLAHSAEALCAVADTGVRIALDDFGAGFCNFGYLKQLPLHALKLDRSMIEGIADNDRDLAVLRGIVAMAQALGLEVIAEGVETEGQRAAVAAEGCTAWQGFLGAEPLAAEDFLGLPG
jgi:EAL domain-containing protein (putative c-di-GMP-specific phosphodiesterase class I)